MKLRRLISLFIAAVLLLTVAGCADENASGKSDSLTGVDNEIVAFRPVDCGVPAQDIYEFPFMGLTVTLTDKTLEMMNSKEVFVSQQSDYTESYAISYAFLRFSVTTEEQRETEVMSIDIISWEDSLERLGAIGVYEKSLADSLDLLTGCDVHEKFGESADGKYVYYISTSSAADADLASEIKASALSVSEMHELNAELGYSAFSTDRLDGVDTVGTFSTEDIFGKKYTEEVFADYDLTLVNVFATWCSPCVEEIPELEKLRSEYEKKGVKLGVVAVVLDAKTVVGLDEGAIERAQTLYERSSANFPFLIPDDGDMNGRLTGIESVPESFFVDKNGVIVSEPYIGANSLKGWRKVVDIEFERAGIN